MQIVLRTEECGDFVRHLPVQSLDEDTREAAQARFQEYYSKGIVIGGAFCDAAWQVTNQLHWFTLDFSINELLYRKNAVQWVGCTKECFQECMKAYVLFQLGSYSMEYIRSIIKSLKTLAGMEMDEAMGLSPDKRIHLVAFLKLLPESNDLRDQVIEALEEKVWNAHEKKPRNMADFSYYLRFNRELDSFWNTANDEEKKWYFPVYYWWKLTAILPLRCTEFLLTPHNCLCEMDGKYVLSIRRTKLKKGRRQVSHVVEEDYVIKKYEIPSWLFEEIRFYQQQTEGGALPTLGTLLVPQRKTSSGYYSYIQMAHLLRNFCRETMNDEDYPIHLGDTRHLAMINLMLSGGSPVICRELAGHESIDVSANYYANLSTVVESMVYEQFHGWGNQSMFQGSLRFPTALPDKKIRVGQGWCSAIEVAQGDVSKCLESYDSDGRVGNCLDCRHFYPDSPGLRAKIEKGCKKRVDEDGKYLMQMIELVRKGIGYEEDIASALLRLQGDSRRYGAILARKYQGGATDGKA